MITMLGGHSTSITVSSGERWIGTIPPGLRSPRPRSTAAGSDIARATTSRTLRELCEPSSAARQSATNWSLSNMVRPPWVLMQPTHVRRAFARQVAHAVLHDEGEALVVLKHADVGQGIAVDQQQIGEIARLDPAELVGPQHRLAAG